MDEAFGSGPVALQSADSIGHEGAPTGPVALGSGLSSGGYSGAVAVRSGDAMGVAGNVSVVAGTASAGGGLALEPGSSSPAFRSHHGAGKAVVGGSVAVEAGRYSNDNKKART